MTNLAMRSSSVISLGRKMQARHLTTIVHLLAVLGIAMTSGCATSFVRSQDTSGPAHVFPASSLDAWCFWHCGIRGKPLFATTDPNSRSHPFTRVSFGVGATTDIPISILSDTILLPLDMTRSRTSRDETAFEPEDQMALAEPK
jgi:uncharacterized protein YceK